MKENFYIWAIILGTLSLFFTRPNLYAKSGSLKTLDLKEYVTLALKQGDRSRVAFNNFDLATNSYKVSYRQTRLPQASVSSSLSRTESEVNSAESTTDGSNGSVNVVQKIYPTGAQLSGSMSGSTSKTDSAGVISRSDAKPNYALSLNQPVYLFTGNGDWRTWKRSRISYLLAEDTYKRELQSIENEARSLYFDVLLKKEQLEVEKTKLDSSERAHNITKALVKAGRNAGIDRSRSEIRLKKDRRRLENAKTALRQSLNTALEFAAIKIEPDIQFTSKLNYEMLRVPLETLINYAFIHRPDYLATKRRLELSEISVKETKEANNLQLALTGSFSKNNSETLLTETKSEEWVGGVNANWALFDSGINRLNVKSAELSFENDLIALKGLERNIETEVTNAYLEVKRNETQLEDLKNSKEEANRTVGVVRTRYKNGIDRLVDVFDSENELRDVELEYLNALIAANLAKDRMELLIGGSLGELGP